MPPAAEGDGEGFAVLLHPHGFVAGGIDAQIVPAFQRAVGIHVHIQLPRRSPIGYLDGKAQFLIQAAGGGVFGRMRLDGEDGRDGGIGNALGRRAILKRRKQFFLQAGGVAADDGAPRSGRGVGQVVGIVLDGAVRKGAAPHIARGFGLPAVAGAVIARCEGRTGIQGHAARFIHGLDYAGVGGGVTAVHLVGGGIHHMPGV